MKKGLGEEAIEQHINCCMEVLSTTRGDRPKRKKKKSKLGVSSDGGGTIAPGTGRLTVFSTLLGKLVAVTESRTNIPCSVTPITPSDSTIISGKNIVGGGTKDLHDPCMPDGSGFFKDEIFQEREGGVNCLELGDGISRWGGE